VIKKILLVIWTVVMSILSLPIYLIIGMIEDGLAKWLIDIEGSYKIWKKRLGIE